DAVLILGFGKEATARNRHFSSVRITGPNAAKLRRANFVVAEFDRWRHSGRAQDRRRGQCRRQFAQLDGVFERNRLALALLFGEIAVPRAAAPSADKSHIASELLDLFLHS